MTMRDRAIEAMARGIVESRGEAADTPVHNYHGVMDHGGRWVEAGPLWKVEGVPAATAALDAILSILAEPSEDMLKAGVIEATMPSLEAVAPYTPGLRGHARSAAEAVLTAMCRTLKGEVEPV